MMRSSVLVGRSLVRRSIAPSGPQRCAPIAAAAPGQFAQALCEHALIVDNPVSTGAYWATLGLVGNSSIFMAQDFIDANFTPTATLSTGTVLAAANMGCLVAAVGGAEVVRRVASLAFPSLQILVGSKAEESSAYADAKARLLRFRIMGLMLGGALGFFPLLWPEDPHFLEGQAFTAKAVPNELLYCEEHFPTALSGPNFERHVFKALAARGWTAKNTLVAYAGCPDEVNDDKKTDLLNVLKQRWRKMFCLGGLAGMAFGGGTGWKAFSTHTPTDGRILVVYGPHTGIASDGAVGSLRRDGQQHDSSCCGACCAAYLSGEEIEHLSHDDMQQNMLTKLLRPYQEKIMESPEPLRWLAYANFELCHDYLKSIITQYEERCVEIAVVGCITVNLPTPCEDYYVPITFETYNCKTGVREDLFREFKVDRQEDLYFDGKVPVFFGDQQGKASVEVVGAHKHSHEGGSCSHGCHCH